MKHASALATTAFAALATGCATVAPPNSVKDSVPDYATPILLQYGAKDYVVGHSVTTRQFIADTVTTIGKSPVSGENIERFETASVVKSDNSFVKGVTVVEKLGATAGKVMTGIGIMDIGAGALEYGKAAQGGKLQDVQNINNSNANQSTSYGSSANATATGGQGGSALNYNNINNTANGGTAYSNSAAGAFNSTSVDNKVNVDVGVQNTLNNTFKPTNTVEGSTFNVGGSTTPPPCRFDCN